MTLVCQLRLLHGKNMLFTHTESLWDTLLGRQWPWKCKNSQFHTRPVLPAIPGEGCFSPTGASMRTACWLKTQDHWPTGVLWPYIYCTFKRFPVKERNSRDMGLAKKRKEEHSRQFLTSNCKKCRWALLMQVSCPSVFVPISLEGHCSCVQELAHGNLEGQVQLTSSKATRGNSTLLNVRHVMQMPKLTANLFKIPQWSAENKKCLKQKQSWDLISLRGRLTVQQ